MPENTTGKELEFSQQQFNTYSTVVQHPEDVNLTKNAYNPDKEIDLEPQEFIQQATLDEGERGESEQTQSEDILQDRQTVNPDSTCSTHLETSAQTNFRDTITSQQKDFTEKYQPVEVLNSEGEWIDSYFVHKCLVVANLEEVARKWALVDEFGQKYAFWGKIRLPKVG